MIPLDETKKEFLKFYLSMVGMAASMAIGTWVINAAIYFGFNANCYFFPRSYMCATFESSQKAK